MSNKETLQNYNARLKTNNISLESILESVNKLPDVKEPALQDKEITITENGSQTIVADEGYDGLSKVDVTVNVEGNGGEEILPITLFDFSNELKRFGETFIKGLMKSSDNDVPYTTSPMTLYTPNEQNKYYVIRERSSGWSVIWFPPCILANSSVGFLTSSVNFSPSQLYNVEGYSFNTTGTKVNSYYYNCNSFEECLNAIQNPTTTYANTQSDSWGSNHEGEYIVKYTNLPCLKTNLHLAPIRILSSNVTIEVIK